MQWIGLPLCLFRLGLFFVCNAYTLVDADRSWLERLSRVEPLDPPVRFQLQLDTSWPDPQVYNHLGIVSALATSDPDGQNVYVLHRGDRVWNYSTFDVNHKVWAPYQEPIEDSAIVRITNGEYDTGFLPESLYLPHGLSIDIEGNFWVTDVGSHQVYKYNPLLQQPPLMTLGERFVPGNDQYHFCKPTHAIAGSNGFIFIADGYCNSRIMKFYPNGTLFKQWGHSVDKGKIDEYSLYVPHQLTLMEDRDLICVSDRENERAVCYSAGLDSFDPSQTGVYKFEINRTHTPVGPVFGIAQHDEKLLYLLSTPREDSVKPSIQVVNLAEGGPIEIFVSDEQAFRMAHHLANCPTGIKHRAVHKSCLLTASIAQPSLDRPVNRIWRFEVIT